MPAPLAPFSLPDRYRLEGAIAAGGMAAVYAAHDTLLDRPVAVKVLADHLSEDETARRRFQREARAAAALSGHPAVVTIYDVGEHDGRSFIVMERRHGGTVRDELDKGRIDPRRALAWLRATAEALDAGHERGVVHRDIKPANLLLDEHDRAAVADFGIARLAYESDQVTQTGQVLGTAAYISPEQAVGDPATPASDRYALAAVAFELLTGRKPFVADHFAAQARAHIEDPVPSASKIEPSLPRAVDAVLRRGLSKDPADRWERASAFVDALESALEEGPPEPTRPMPAQALAATAPPPPPRAAAPAPARAPEPPGPPAGGRAKGRFPVAVVAAIVALLLVSAAALAIAMTGGDDAGTARDEERPAQDRAEATATAEARETPTAEPTPEPTAESTPEPPAEPTGDGAAALNDQGFQLFQAGDYAASVPYFRRAVEACGDSTELTCAYATYNLGAALNRSGDPQAAIPVLRRRLEVWPDDQPDAVRAELRSACEAAGQDCGDLSEGAGEAKGKDKDKDKDENRGRGNGGD